VILDPVHLTFFLENIMTLIDVNRVYMWAIFFDHVLMQELEPMEFFVAVKKNIKLEHQEMVIPFLLQKCQYILQHFPSANPLYKEAKTELF